MNRKSFIKLQRNTPIELLRHTSYITRNCGRGLTKQGIISTNWLSLFFEWVRWFFLPLGFLPTSHTFKPASLGLRQQEQWGAPPMRCEIPSSFFSSYPVFQPRFSWPLVLVWFSQPYKHQIFFLQSFFLVNGSHSNITTLHRSIANAWPPTQPCMSRKLLFH